MNGQYFAPLFKVILCHKVEYGVQHFACINLLDKDACARYKLLYKADEWRCGFGVSSKMIIGM